MGLLDHAHIVPSVLRYVLGHEGEYPRLNFISSLTIIYSHEAHGRI